MGHDDGADQPGAHAPAGFVHVGQLAFLAEVLDVVGLGKVGAEVVAGAGLQRLAVLHHGFHAVSCARAGKLLLIALAAHQHRHGQLVLGHLAVDVQHLHGFFLGFLRRRVDGMAFLPEKLAGAKERARALFPAHHAAPLVVLHGQIAPAAHPLGIHGAKNGFACGAHGQAFLQLFAAALRHPSHLRRKAFHMLGFLEQQAFGNEHGHVDVLMPGGFEAPIQRFLDALPNGEAVRTDNHATAHGRVVHQLAFENHVCVPLGKIHVARGDVLHEALFFFVRHVASSFNVCKKVPFAPDAAKGHALGRREPSRYHPA